MTVSTFVCIDGHTCGNPVRLVVGGALEGLGLWWAMRIVRGAEAS